MGNIGFRSHHPLVDQSVENLSVGLRFSINELLVAAESPDITPQDDVVFDSRHDAVHDLLRRQRPRRRHCQRHQETEDCKPAH